MSIASVQVVHAGSYPTTPVNGSGAGVSTDAGDSLTAPPNAYAPEHNRNDPQSGNPLESTTDYQWVWTPTGPLVNDPAPLRAVNLNYIISGGPVKATVTGVARVGLGATLYADESTSNTSGPAFQPYVYITSTNQTFPLPTGTQTVVIPTSSGRIQILNGDTLVFTNTNSAQSWSHLEAGLGGIAKAEFNTLHIQTSTLTLQP